MLGGIAARTSRLTVGTGVTCPTTRTHPAVIAQAAATTADMFEGRFFLGVGTGENLNEHILGDRWPPTDVRLEMLEGCRSRRRGWSPGNPPGRGLYGAGTVTYPRDTDGRSSSVQDRHCRWQLRRGGASRRSPCPRDGEDAPGCVDIPHEGERH